MAEAESAEEALAHNAARAAKLALFCLVVAVLVLAIDHRLKQHIIQEGRRALALLEEARKLAEEARSGARETGQDGAAAGAAVNGSDGVVHAPGASKTAGANARSRTGSRSGSEAGEE